ncbi:MAG: hypothetical protein JJU46_10790 [Balneolaceae bacterium]|nr:hypothetical protein [Balneolaceae bacterium]MCH8549563.1 hypothetical protein [Balneolaceae bacterium]
MLKYKRRARAVKGREITTPVLIVLEVFAIVIGVLIGFMVNEWREDRSNRLIADKALESVAAEFRYNHQRMVETYQYYTLINDQITALNESGESVVSMYGYQLEGWRGAMPPMLRSSSYQMILSTGILKDIPFEAANQLAFIYNLQSLLERFDDSIIASFTQDSGFTSLQNIYHLFGLYTELIPSVIGSYQLIGTPLLHDYGYTLSVEDERLKQEMDQQMTYFDMDQF